ncbi:MAG TPA: cysteine--tRNA ligase [Chloroflexi bacterium]|nr:cysteine--tRNA ligase [Chloroflexota bacterium]
MKLYNTLSRRKEVLLARQRPISVYVCGITPYDTTHLGHAFTYINTDVLIRYLEYRGSAVRYVQNVTDIDDDILRKAGTIDEDWKGLGDRWTAHFIRDMQSLNARPPERFPRATETIPEIIEVVQKLLANGVAYEAAGNVYFDLTSWPEYGKLSELSYEEMLPIANERGNRPDDPHKRDPLDFVLWQAQAPGEPAWESPWGLGRPGWHIECTSMAMRYLGNTVDVHGGGSDLIFPHHESEIAQAECAIGEKPFVRFWMHTAMVHHEGEKMSKSLGNLVMVRDLLETWSPDAIRLYLSRHHYREVWHYDEEALREAAQWAHKLRSAVVADSGRGPALDPASAVAAFIQAMDDDLQTPEALPVLSQLADDVLSSSECGQDVGAAQEALREMSGVFGLRLDANTPEQRVLEGWDEHLQDFV